MTGVREWAAVSEELRTTLMSIRGSLALIESGAAGPLPPAARELVGIAARNCERLVALANLAARGALPNGVGAAGLSTYADRR